MKHYLRALIQPAMLGFLLAGAFQTEGQQAGASRAGQPAVMLGVLEDHPGVHTGDPNFWRVRAVFEKKGSEWEAFPNPCTDLACLKGLAKRYPKEVNWTITFDGRDLGQVTARTPPQFLDLDSVGTEQITSSGPVPTVGKRSMANSGFYYSPAYRSLVAVSKPYFKDPDVWKPSHLSTELPSALRQRFRGKFPKVSNCRNPAENILRSWPYRDEDIRIGKTYSSKENWSLAELHLPGWNCDAPQEDGSPFLAQWYAIAPTGEIRFLGSGMWLIDAGDYDGDGRSEVLFAVEGFAKDGYRLFYQDLQKSAEFSFYHN
jgi:hypothetical protein